MNYIIGRKGGFMKKNYVLVIGIIIGVLFSGVTVYAAVQYLSKDVTFTPSNSNWNVSNVEDALNHLYEQSDVSNILINQPWNFDYRGSEQTFIVPTSGYYKLETWGAQGGSYNTTYYGGYGAYSTGKIYLSKGETLYINVGGIGTSAKIKNVGGYNGGGDRSDVTSSDSYLGTGGGATHIAKVSGLLSQLESYKGEYSDATGTYDSNKILIVSAGGGGSYYHNSSYYGIGGSGGGISGTAGYSYRSGTEFFSELATQTTGYKFGEGNVGYTYTSGGGAGWYGGLALQNTSGGGSSYIGSSLLTDKVMYCYNCVESNNESTKTVSTTNVSEIPTANYAKNGHGYARITLISTN